MIISKKTKYGLRAMFHLARAYNKGPILITTLAKEERIPHKFLENILLSLKNNGLLMSKKGKGGGYFLSRNPKEITLAEVIRFLEGPLAPVTCVSRSAYRPCGECVDEQTCAIRLIMKDVRDAMVNILDKITLVDANERADAIRKKYCADYVI